MSGHSKWSTIKRKKEAQDSKRGQQFTKLGNAIAIAARRGGGDPETNTELRMAIEQAKSVNMPNTNIERSIKRGTGELGGGPIEEVMYEGYGPAGVAVLVECATDNRNRTSADVRSAFSKQGGNMAEPGAVAYQFERKGVITVKADNQEAAMLEAIDAGAEDVIEDEGELAVYVAPSELNEIKETLNQNYKVKSAELSYEPKNTVVIETEEDAKKIMKLMDALDALEDVSNTYSNFDITEEIATRIG
ncbi:MAG: YebC/PmpR family DNA-binding transcriptional regulator [Candidatus Saccharimonadales bacterium]